MRKTPGIHWKINICHLAGGRGIKLKKKGIKKIIGTDEHSNPS